MLERRSDRDLKQRIIRELIGSIAHAPGVTHLKDHIRIDPYF